MNGEKDFCWVCNRVVPESTEHDYAAHGSSREQTEALRIWKQELKKTGQRHQHAGDQINFRSAA